MSQTLATTIRNPYYHSPSSIAASLRRALIAGNSFLLDAGSAPSASPEQQGNRRITAGAVVMTVRGREVFVATVGPSAAYLLSRGRPICFPETPHWPEERTTHTPDAPILGRSLDVEIDISHASVADGDIFVLGDGRFAKQASREVILAALSSRTVEDALAVLGKMASEQDCTVLVAQVRLLPEIDSRGDREPVMPRSPSARLPARDFQPKEDRRADGGSGGAMPNMAHLPVGQIIRSIGIRLGRLLVFVGQGVFTVFRGALPGRPNDELPSPQFESTQKPEEAGRRIPQRLLRAVALILPLLVLLLVLGVYWRQIADRQAAYDASLAQAAALYEQAVGTQDGATAHALLQQADGLLGAAAEVNQDDPFINDLRSSVQVERDRVRSGGKVELDWPGVQLRGQPCSAAPGRRRRDGRVCLGCREQCRLSSPTG